MWFIFVVCRPIFLVGNVRKNVRTEIHHRLAVTPDTEQEEQSTALTIALPITSFKIATSAQRKTRI